MQVLELHDKRPGMLYELHMHAGMGTTRGRLCKPQPKREVLRRRSQLRSHVLGRQCRFTDGRYS
jgi:hypothetical protein